MFLLCCLAPVHAADTSTPAEQENSELCPPSPRADKQARPEVDPEDKQTHISADEAKVDSENLTIFRGNVKVRQGNRFLDADNIQYDRQTEIFTAEGKVTYSVDDIYLKGSNANMNMKDNKGSLENADYYTGSVKGRGQAKIIIIENDKRFRMEEATYTTCPPDKEAWRLNASSIILDKSTRQGSASNAVIEIADIPVLYLPYIRFPLGEERMSGLLFPAIAVTETNGTEISIPYYWNIAPNMDSTITLHNMTERGVMLENEFRYLTESTNGNIDFNYLPDDKKFSEDRKKFTWLHSGTPAAGWSTSVDYNYVSDTEYLDDFSGSLATSSVTHLNRKGTLSYNSESFLFSTLVQEYQNLTGSEPYRRVPQLQFDTRFSNEEKKLNYDLVSEYVNFDHTNDSQIVGTRIKISPFLSYTIKEDAGFFMPKLSYHHIQYALDNITSPTQAKNPSADVPVFSLDTGIFLERDTEIAGTKLLHTLEPRLFYLYAPYKDQSSLPNFDTGLTSFSETLLFSENRFSGNDRVGDANRLTTSLTTRFYRQQDGTELFSATLGQIIYFRDREVILPGGVTETSDRSNYIGLLNFNPHRNWRLNSDIQWDPETKHTEVGNSRIQYNSGNGHIFNIDYRYRRNELRSRGISTAWRINPRWQVFAGNQYDIKNEHTQEEFFGIRYDDCCWGLRILATKKFDKLEGTNPRFEHAVFIELELKGLSSLGSRKKIETVLENGILGYSE